MLQSRTNLNLDRKATTAVNHMNGAVPMTWLLTAIDDGDNQAAACDVLNLAESNLSRRSLSTIDFVDLAGL